MECDYAFMTIAEGEHRPKYKLIAENIKRAVGQGKLVIGSQLPSINQVCELCKVSRDTAVKAYHLLEEEHLLRPVHGKGFFICSEQVEVREKIMLLFDSLAMFKETIFLEISRQLADKYAIDIFFHHMNVATAVMLLKQHGANYDWIGMIPPEQKCSAEIRTVLDRMEDDGKRIFLLDFRMDGSNYPYAVQNFCRGIYSALEKDLSSVRKYKSLQLVCSESNYIIDDIKKGFTKFCRDYKLAGVVGQCPEKVSGDVLYIVINDSDLGKLVKSAAAEKFSLGRDVGIISYNDTPLKEIIGTGGISVVTTDFRQIGAAFVEFILSGRSFQREIDTGIIRRYSF